MNKQVKKDEEMTVYTITSIMHTMLHTHWLKVIWIRFGWYNYMDVCVCTPPCPLLVHTTSFVFRVLSVYRWVFDMLEMVKRRLLNTHTVCKIQLSNVQRCDDEMYRMFPFKSIYTPGFSTGEWKAIRVLIRMMLLNVSLISSIYILSEIEWVAFTFKSFNLLFIIKMISKLIRFLSNYYDD